MKPKAPKKDKGSWEEITIKVHVKPIPEFTETWFPCPAWKVGDKFAMIDGIYEIVAVSQ